MSTIAILSDTLPTLPSQPGSPRLFALASEWHRHFRIVFICISEPVAKSEELEQLFDEIIFLPPAPTPSYVGKLRHRLNNASYFDQNYRCPTYVSQIQGRVSQIVTTREVDHVHVNQLANAQFIPPALSNRRVTIDIRDALPLLYEREAALCSRFRDRMALTFEVHAIGRCLRRLASRGYRLSMVAKADADYLLEKWGVETVVMANGVDTEYFSVAVNSDRVRPVAIFTGVMNYGPNIETAHYFAETIFPKARESCPNLEFWIVGANPTESVRELARIPGITVTGMVPDIRPYLHEAAVFVCPMRSGTGIKNKILAAMAAELPVVASALGVAGVDAQDNQHFFLREDPTEFARTVVSVVHGDLATTHVFKSAKELILQKYDWPAVAKNFASIFATPIQGSDCGFAAPGEVQDATVGA